MPTITLLTYINAPAERVFDLSRSITLHTISMEQTGEKAVDGITSGLIQLNETVTWQARHLFKLRTLQTRITAMKPYSFFTDEMVRGDFAMMKHEHYFISESDGTLMKDVFEFETPFGFIGKMVDVLFLKSYMRKLLTDRNRVIKEFAETDKWQGVLE